MDELQDAKEYGSILNVTMLDFPALYARLAEVEEDISIHRESALNTIKPLIQVAEALAQKYCNLLLQFAEILIYWFVADHGRLTSLMSSDKIKAGIKLSI